MNWQIDPAHSEIQFSVRHMMISKVRGSFESFSGTVDLDEENPTNSQVEVQIQVDSINTRDAQRDGHLKSADFLNAEEYPLLTFKSNRVEKMSENTARLHGDLTIRGQSRGAVLDVTYNGQAKSPWGTYSAGFEAKTRINRKEWGLTWNQALETGGVLVGEDIDIAIELELVRQEEPEQVPA